jgi:hypothetical protein
MIAMHEVVISTGIYNVAICDLIDMPRILYTYLIDQQASFVFSWSTVNPQSVLL